MGKVEIFLIVVGVLLSVRGLFGLYVHLSLLKKIYHTGNKEIDKTGKFIETRKLYDKLDNVKVEKVIFYFWLPVNYFFKDIEKETIDLQNKLEEIC